MTPVQSMVAVTYVRDIDTSRAFYELLGFREHSAGRAATSAWSYLRQDRLSVLLASTRPPLEIPPLPLLFYFYCDDVDAVAAVLGAGGIEVTRTGHPPHALGGEMKVLDPDGNTVLVGQQGGRRPRRRCPMTTPRPGSRCSRRRRPWYRPRAGPPWAARSPLRAGRRAREKAEVKLADSGGDVAWACLAHADEILITVPAAFIASRGEPGIAAFLSLRQ